MHDGFACTRSCKTESIHSRCIARLLTDQFDAGVSDGITTSEREQMKVLQRENKELRKANDILQLASAFFAQAEPGRRLKS